MKRDNLKGVMLVTPPIREFLTNILPGLQKYTWRRMRAWAAGVSTQIDRSARGAQPSQSAAASTRHTLTRAAP
jgi:hypothetical protein